LIFSVAQALFKNWPKANFLWEPEQLRKSIGTQPGSLIEKNNKKTQEK